ncbi:MAG: hypothetical protein NTX61_03095 [Bacteroidetes bacterium]|nr:hypothetical protein [Bacteroidota bacterium]
MTSQQLEKYSSAFTLSDMEIFIFPELLYALVLSNIMSPEIWKWRDDPWFTGINKMGPLKKIHRLKQYIMDHYNFNLDLETWGLTDKQTEIERFRDFVDIDLLSRSNALFGYEGDKYYFDIDIRKHFGLDKFDTDIIPYWKTETVEAMNAFRFKPGYETGAGECVSLACLYAAALFIVAGIPLENIFLMGTPLHSQNFVLVDEGVLTNNRRIVTKSMWFNGTELSSLACRALEHEHVTIVAHQSGYIHAIYPEATIDQQAYHLFREKLTHFLETSVDFEIFINFLRDYSKYQKLFQISYPCRGFTKYISLEKAFSYEHGSKNRLGEKTGRKLLCEMEEEDFYLQPIDARFILNPDDKIFSQQPYHPFLDVLHLKFPKLSENKSFIHDFKKFVHTEPKLPSSNKNYSPIHQLTISPSQSREEIVNYLSGFRRQSPVTSHEARGTRHEASGIRQQAIEGNSNLASETVDLAFYAGRFMDSCDWEPFLKAAFERNPVSISYFHDRELETVYCELKEWPNESIYEENRLALPDEVVNFGRGDGIEKAITLVNILKSRHIISHIEIKDQVVLVKTPGKTYDFLTDKNLKVPHITF